MRTDWSLLRSPFITGYYPVLPPSVIKKQSACLGEIWPNAVQDIANVELNKTL
jgi:hypothetical protein